MAMNFDASVWGSKTHEGWKTGEEIINYMNSCLEDLKDYISNLEGEIERLEKENEKLEENKDDSYSKLQDTLDRIEVLENLLDKNGIDY